MCLTPKLIAISSMELFIYLIKNILCFIFFFRLECRITAFLGHFPTQSRLKSCTHFSPTSLCFPVPLMGAQCHLSAFITSVFCFPPQLSFLKPLILISSMPIWNVLVSTSVYTCIHTPIQKLKATMCI